MYKCAITTIISAYIWVTVCGVEASGTAFVFEIPDNQRFCLMEKFEGPKRLILNYKVIRGGNNDVDAFIKSPNGKLIYRKLRSKEGEFAFESTKGEYMFCFGNEFSTVSHKYVYFDLRPEDTGSLSDETGLKKPFVKGAAESSCDTVHESMTTVVNYQRDYRLKESIGRHLAEVLNNRISIWSVGQAILMLLAGFGQVFVMKRFFTEKQEVLQQKENA